MRLDKYVCLCTSVSRTQAKTSIRKGDIRVDDVVIRDPAHVADALATITCRGSVLTVPGRRYLMLNKPADSVCTSLADDARSVLALLAIQNADDLHIAGRLDIDTTGLLLVTDDGAWSHRLTSPKKKKGKRYHVRLAEPLAANAGFELESGVQLKGERHLTRPAQLECLSPQEVLLTIHEGKYHQVKRMFAALGNRVVALHREQIGDIKLDSSLAPGEWRELTDVEIASV